MVIDFSNLYNFPRYNNLFEDMFRTPNAARRQAAYPPLNLSEDGDNLYVRVEVPGASIEDIELTLTEKSLVVRGERKAEEGKYFRQERMAGRFQRIVSLNSPVNRDGVAASMTDGLLEVVLPKADEVKPKKIDITVS